MRLVLAISLQMTVGVSVAAAAAFIPLNPSPEPGYHGQPMGISADGSAVVGFHYTPGSYGFYWTAESGLVDIGPPTILLNSANAVSADGKIVVAGTLNFNGDEAFRWEPSGAKTVIIPAAHGGWPLGISYDGSVIAGWHDPAGYREAFRWTAADGVVGLGDLPGGSDESLARGVSGDGNVIVGFGSVEKDGLISSEWEAFRWTAATGMVGLGNLGELGAWSSAGAASADGSVIVGWAASSQGTQGFLWTEQTGMVGLGDLPGGTFSSNARGVSADGSVVVGGANLFDYDQRGDAFIWTAAAGMKKVTDVLEAQGVDLTGWQLSYATGISADGTRIIGFGTGPHGNEVPWLAIVPEPASWLMGSLACGAAIFRMRRPR
jgi:probable HAF family extracellular repeat protein